MLIFKDIPTCCTITLFLTELRLFKIVLSINRLCVFLAHDQVIELESQSVPTELRLKNLLVRTKLRLDVVSM